MLSETFSDMELIPLFAPDLLSSVLPPLAPDGALGGPSVGCPRRQSPSAVMKYYGNKEFTTKLATAVTKMQEVMVEEQRAKAAAARPKRVPPRPHRVSPQESGGGGRSASQQTHGWWRSST